MISPVGKVVVIKSLALAKLNHLILSIPSQPLEKVNLIQNLFLRFLGMKEEIMLKYLF